MANLHFNKEGTNELHLTGPCRYKYAFRTWSSVTCSNGNNPHDDEVASCAPARNERVFGISSGELDLSNLDGQLKNMANFPRLIFQNDIPEHDLLLRDLHPRYLYSLLVEVFPSSLLPLSCNLPYLVSAVWPYLPMPAA